MNTLKTQFLFPIIATLIAELLFAFIVVILSKYNTGDWLQYIITIPFYYYIIVALVVIILYLLIKGKKKGYGSFAITQKMGENKPIGEVARYNVLWRIVVNEYSFKRHPLTHLPNIDVNDVSVSLPARCPNCKCELEEIKTFFGRFVWSCLKCKFETKSKYNFYELSSKVLKIARIEIENDNETNSTYITEVPKLKGRKP